MLFLDSWGAVTQRCLQPSAVQRCGTEFCYRCAKRYSAQHTPQCTCGQFDDPRQTIVLARDVPGWLEALAALQGQVGWMQAVEQSNTGLHSCAAGHA
jgi:hypothetical protein